MKRRKFIGVIGIGTAAIATGGYISFSDFDDAVKRVITQEAGALKLKVDTKEIDSFVVGAREFGLWDTYSFNKKELIKWFSRIGNLGKSLPLFYKFNRYKQEILHHFLFASSFFYDGMDVNKPVRYLRIYDPYSTPCCNPFSNLYYSS